MAPGRLDSEGGGDSLHAVTAEDVIKKPASSPTNLSKEHDIVLRTFRLLIADLCQQFGGGHPG